MNQPKKRAATRRKAPARRASGGALRCGLCGKRGKLVRTECCGHRICDDEENYVLFSYARNRWHRNDRRMTLCAYRQGEGHAGKWQDCAECRASFQAEIYVWYGTNEYNFEKLPNPPAYEPTRCDRCGVVIKLADSQRQIANRRFQMAKGRDACAGGLRAGELKSAREGSGGAVQNAGAFARPLSEPGGGCSSPALAVR
jgi:hypothetical protein